MPTRSTAPAAGGAGPTVVIAGGSGFLGQSLASFLQARESRVVVLTRRPSGHHHGDEVEWDGVTVGPWATELDGATAVVNLAGRSVNCRYNETNRREILQSRLRSVRAIAAAIDRCATPPGVWVQAASLAIYGDARDTVCDERAPLATGFSAQVCQAWEAAFADAQTSATRKVLLRMGFALGTGGGALEPLARLARFGLGGRAGTGRQFISWIHGDDLDRMVEEAITAEDVAGIYNATGPRPVTNAEFMRTLRGALHRPWSPPVPRTLVHVGALLMRTEPELALTGRRCVPSRFQERGFAFRYPDLPGALADVLSRAG